MDNKFYQDLLPYAISGRQSEWL